MDDSIQCPQCGGRYGAFITSRLPHRGKIIVSTTWRCDCDVNGGELSLMEWLPGADNPTMKPLERRPGRPCGYIGPIDAKDARCE